LPSVGRGITAFDVERSKGSSCLKGNFHEQFLGGLAGAIPPGYPAGDSDVISLPAQIDMRAVACPASYQLTLLL
jgi:hypothetical protein